MESKILGGRYELLERVGMGGMAVVYKATDKMLGRNVAVKILREEFKENEEFIRRFKVESQAAASLSHQNIVQIYDVGEEDGLHYIVMELLEGVTLKNYINSKEGILSKREAMNFAMQICRALEHAHSKHVVHRDIKPQNIVLTESGKIKVADFGIARAANNTTTVNSGQYAVGSAHYLSPEQARGGYTDNRSDIYSFGVVLYELFTGVLPFDAEESIGVVMKHINEEPRLPSEINPDITPGIEAIILRAMCKEQRLRYASATEILEDLVTVYQNPSVSVSELNAYDEEAVPVIVKKPVTKGNRSRTARRKKKNQPKKGLIILLSSVLAVLLIAVITIFTLMFSSTGKEYEVPDLIGMTFEEAASVADNKSFKVSIAEEKFDDAPKGTVIDQDPESGFKTKNNKEIDLVVSRGPVVLTLEDYTGKDFIEISEMLEEKGIIVKVEQKLSDKYPEGKIIKHLPSEGTQMGEGYEITITVSKGIEYIYVPNVVGLPQQEAIVAIENWDLEVKVIEEASDTVLKGEVIRQNPKRNTKIVTGETVEIYVSTGKEKVEDPAKPSGGSTDKPSSNKPRKVSIPLSNLDKNVPVKVKIMLDGKKVYEADVTTSTGNATVTFEIEAGIDTSQGADIYYNDTYIDMKEVK